MFFRYILVFFICITMHSFHLFAIKVSIKQLVCLLILIQYMFFHISMNSQRKEKSTVSIIDINMCKVKNNRPMHQIFVYF